MYTKPAVSRFGTFRDLTQLGCTGISDITIPGIGAADGSIPEIVKGADGIFTTKVCFSFVSGM